MAMSHVTIEFPPPVVSLGPHVACRILEMAMLPCRYIVVQTHKTKDRMLHNVWTIEWMIEIACHVCSVAMVTSQKCKSVR